MQTPEDQTMRRSLRRALTEIPAHLSISTLNQEGRRSLNNVQNNLLDTANNIFDGTSIPPTFLSPSPSPDEMIIRQRGRRHIPVTFSPDIDELKRNRGSNQKDRTPVKQASSPSLCSSIVLRSTPRKRLLLPDLNESNIHSHNSCKLSPKKTKVDRSLESNIETVSCSLKACSSNQLIQVIENLIKKHPELKQDLEDIIPEPDLKPLEVHLTFLKRNIVKALPTSRLCSKTDALAYHRASAHLTVFKNSMLDHGRRLTGSKQWATVMDFVLMAWKLVRMLPTFDNQSHNLPKKQCFKFLTSQFILAVKQGNFSVEQLDNYIVKMKMFVADSDELKLQLLQLEDKVKNS